MDPFSSMQGSKVRRVMSREEERNRNRKHTHSCHPYKAESGRRVTTWEANKETDPLFCSFLLHALFPRQLLVSLPLPLVESRGEDTANDVSVFHHQDHRHIGEESQLRQEGSLIRSAGVTLQDEPCRPGQIERCVGSLRVIMSLLGGDALTRPRSWHINIETGLEQPKE